jgi:hypothetical protein
VVLIAAAIGGWSQPSEAFIEVRRIEDGPPSSRLTGLRARGHLHGRLPVRGIEARQQERKRFIELADRLARSRDVEEQTRLKEELAVMTFGE